MNLVYMGESGNTGNSINDPNQFHHVHVGLIVHENQCISMNGEFNALCRRHLGYAPGEAGTPRGLKPADIYQGRGFFNSWSPEKRGELIKDCLEILIRREIPAIVTYIDKREYVKFRAADDSPYAIWNSPSEFAISKFLFALNLVVDEMSVADMAPDDMMNSPWQVKDYTLIVAGQGQSVEPQFMNQFLASEEEIPSPSVIENFCYVGAEHSVCTQLANMCAYFARRWLQNPNATHSYYEALQEGMVIQVVYPVQFY